MLDTIKPLLLNRRDQFPIAHDRRRRVTVICIDSEYVHSVRSGQVIVGPRVVFL